MVDNTDNVSYHKRKLILKRKEEATQDVKCPVCNTLLYKVLYRSEGSLIETRCRKCGYVHRGL